MYYKGPNNRCGQLKVKRSVGNGECLGGFLRVVFDPGLAEFNRHVGERMGDEVRVL